MIGSTKAVVLSRQLWKVHLFRRTVYAEPPTNPMKTWESLAGLGIITLGCLAVPAWIMTHIDDYKARE